jgi:hypothetical protein
MKIIRRKSMDVKSEFIHRGKAVIREALAELFSSNPDIYSISFKTEAIYSGHEYSEYSKLYDFRAKLEPISPGMGNDIDNYVEVSRMPVGHILREYVGSLAVILRDLRMSALDLFGCGTIILKREDWVATEVRQFNKIDIPGPCVAEFEF